MPDLKVNVGWNFGTFVVAATLVFSGLFVSYQMNKYDRCAESMAGMNLNVITLTTEVKGLREDFKKLGKHGTAGSAP